MGKNELVNLLEQERSKRKIKSYRALSCELKFSHTHITDVVHGRRPVTWDFAATVADWLGIEKIKAFELAGLL